MNQRQIRGKFGEDYTADYLINNNYRIISRNFRRKGGELDIVSLCGSVLVVTEVKTRKTGSLTDGMDAMTITKIRNIIRTAERFLDECDIEFTEMRFDVAEVEVTTEEIPRVLDFRYYEDAFTADYV